MSSAHSEIEKSRPDVERPAPAIGVWHPPPAHPPPLALASGATEGRATVGFLAAVTGLVFGLPLGLPGMVLGTLAYFLGKSAVNRIDSSQGALGGRGVAVSAWVLGAIAMGVGAAVTLAWLVVVLVAISQPAAG
ncbi:MAG TPA: hypothetical protein VIO37_09515 [Candidatus Dormibacteraeota bacterium]